MLGDRNPSIIKHRIPLGELTGLQFESGARQFLGIQYAAFPRRFAPSTLLTDWSSIGNKIDATRYGPRGIQKFDEPWFEPQKRPWLPDSGIQSAAFQNETELDSMLTLNITVPKTTKTKLPVMFWIHGGANVYGGVNWCEFDGLGLSDLSAKLEKPVIMVTCQFRLGHYGYFCSSEIQSYNKATELDDGTTANFGFWDQVNALRWVQKYISHFGGDPDNVTVFGQSAGSASVMLHLCSGLPLYKRAMLHSGVFEVCGVNSMRQSDELYFKVLDILGIKGDTPHERVEKLIAAESLDVVNAIESMFKDKTFALLPFIDEEAVFHGVSDVFSVKIPEFVDAILVSDTNEEFPVTKANWTNLTPANFVKYLRDQCSRELFDTLLKHYRIGEDMSQDEVYITATLLCSDSAFLCKNYAFVNSLCDKVPVYCYHFDEKSPFAKTKGYAHHSLDLLYIWNNYNNLLSENVCVSLASGLIKFAYGEAPWDKYTAEDHKYRVFGPEGSVHTATEVEDVPRGARYDAWREIIEKGLYNEFVEVCFPLGYELNGSL